MLATENGQLALFARAHGQSGTMVPGMQELGRPIAVHRASVPSPQRLLLDLTATSTVKMWLATSNDEGEGPIPIHQKHLPSSLIARSRSPVSSVLVPHSLAPFNSCEVLTLRKRYLREGRKEERRKETDCCCGGGGGDCATAAFFSAAFICGFRQNLSRSPPRRRAAAAVMPSEHAAATGDEKGALANERERRWPLCSVERFLSSPRVPWSSNSAILGISDSIEMNKSGDCEGERRHGSKLLRSEGHD